MPRPSAAPTSTRPGWVRPSQPDPPCSSAALVGDGTERRRTPDHLPKGRHDPEPFLSSDPPSSEMGECPHERGETTSSNSLRPRALPSLTSSDSLAIRKSEGTRSRLANEGELEAAGTGDGPSESSRHPRNILVARSGLRANQGSPQIGCSGEVRLRASGAIETSVSRCRCCLTSSLSCGPPGR